MVGNLEFYQANETDLDCIFKIVDSVGWGETYEDIQRVIKNPDNKYLTVFDRKTAEIIGITLAVVNDEVGFIGHVIVKPEYRKMGIGEELMNEAINYLKFKGCKTIKLDAVTEAVTLYERTGFKFEFNSLRYLKTITSTAEIEKLLEKCLTVEQKYIVNNCKEDDLREIFEADHELFGGNRDNFLLGMFEDYPEFCFITRDTDEFLKGYLFGTYKAGILKLRAGISDTYETTINLLKAAILTFRDAKELQTIELGVVENSNFGVKAMEFLGFEKTGFSLRMYLGEQTEKGINPAIFAIGDPAKG